MNEETSPTMFDDYRSPAPAGGASWEELDAPLAGLVAGVGPAELREVVRHVFVGLTRLLGRLHEVEYKLAPEGPFDAPLFVLTDVRIEAEALHDFVGQQVGELGDADASQAALHDVLDGMTYALRHELRRVYNDELRGLDTLRSPASVHAQIGRAAALLRNCFQQALITLAQVFDPALDGAALFGDADGRLEQSLALSKELWVLVSRARRAAGAGDRDSVVSFVEGLKRFRRASMHYLMYRDWHEFEGHARRVLGAGGAEELAPVLTEFTRYLENILALVRKRAVLADRPEARPEAE